MAVSGLFDGLPATLILVFIARGRAHLGLDGGIASLVIRAIP